MSLEEFVSERAIENITPNGVTLRVYKDRPKSLDRALRETARRFPGREAVVDAEKRLTYKDFDDLVGRVASALVDKFKIKPKDRVAFLMGNHYRWPLVFFALARIGAISIPLNNRLQSPEIAYQITNSQSRLLVADEKYLERINKDVDGLSCLEAIVVNGQCGVDKFTPLSELELYDSQEVLVGCNEEDIACILYTSGTTGFPKGAMLSHRNMLSVSMAVDDILQYDETDRMLFFIPLFHVTGLVGMLLAMIVVGGANIILPEFKRHEIPEIIEREKITTTMGVPATFILIMDSPNYKKYSRSSIRSILYGGSPAPPEMHGQLTDSLPRKCILVDGYGLTEASSNVLITPAIKDRTVIHKYGAIGLPNHLTDVRVVDEQGRDVALGEVGELWIRGPGVCSGYWNAEEQTKETIKDGWLATGDLVSQDEHGYFGIKGRKKQMINRGGENIYPVEIERVLYSHSDVLEAAVVGIPDPVMGEEVKAVIVPKDNHKCDLDELTTYLKNNLADYKVPKFIVTVKDLPRNPGGKVESKKLISL